VLFSTSLELVILLAISSSSYTEQQTGTAEQRDTLVIQISKETAQNGVNALVVYEKGIDKNKWQ
jgi:hypothetical protein